MNETISSIINNCLNEWASVAILFAMLATIGSAVGSLAGAGIAKLVRNLIY